MTKTGAVTVTGFSLIELLAALAIVAILAAIALPSYQDSVRKARRADAKAALNDIAQRLERCRTQFGTYNDTGCVIVTPQESPEHYYSVVTVRDARTYTLTATPQGAQRADKKCTSFLLDHLGRRSAMGSQAADCWR